MDDLIFPTWRTELGNVPSKAQGHLPLAHPQVASGIFLCILEKVLKLLPI